MAVEAGLGQTGFYIAPARDDAALTGYITKWEGDPSAQRSRSRVAGELSKASQAPGLVGLMPRHFRRFRASGSAGDGKETSFFLDEPIDDWRAIQGKGTAEQTWELESVGIVSATIDSVDALYRDLGATQGAAPLLFIDRRDSETSSDPGIAGDEADKRGVLEAVEYQASGRKND